MLSSQPYLTALMPKSSKKSGKTDWKSLVEAVAEETSGDLPWFVTVKENVWHSFDVKPATMEVHKDGGPDKEWSCIRVEIDVDDSFEEMEVPFWAMKPFVESLLEADEGEEVISMSYKRLKNGARNDAKFQVN